LKEKRSRARDIKKLLREKSGGGRWSIVREELTEISGALRSTGGKRRTIIEEAGEEPELSAEDLIIAEDSHVLITHDGWIKRQREIKDLATTRLREGDSVLACFAGSTTATVIFFSNFGTAYTIRIADIVATTGYGEPIQKTFKLKDGERIISAFSLDKRVTGDLSEVEGYFPETFGCAATSDGFAVTFGLSTFSEPSTKAGRRFLKLNQGQEVIGAHLVQGDETVIAATVDRRALLTPVDQISYLSAAGKGVILIKLGSGDRVLATRAVRAPDETLTVKTCMGGEQRINTAKYEVSTRGGRGREIIKRGTLVEALPELATVPDPFE
jgi:DNA gyrase subunit A